MELSNPLIALGLATDSGLVQKVIKLIAPNKFANVEDFEEEELSLKEFSRLFELDAIGEKSIKILS